MILDRDLLFKAPSICFPTVFFHAYNARIERWRNRAFCRLRRHPFYTGDN